MPVLSRSAFIENHRSLKHPVRGVVADRYPAQNEIIHPDGRDEKGRVEI